MLALAIFAAVSFLACLALVWLAEDEDEDGFHYPPEGTNHDR